MLSKELPYFFDEVTDQFSEPLTPPQDQRHHRPFLAQSYMNERDAQLPENAFNNLPITEEGLGDQQHELKVNDGMEIEKEDSQNATESQSFQKEDVKAPQLSLEAQTLTGSTNPSTSELQQNNINLQLFSHLSIHRKNHLIVII